MIAIKSILNPFMRLEQNYKEHKRVSRGAYIRRTRHWIATVKHFFLFFPPNLLWFFSFSLGCHLSYSIAGRRRRSLTSLTCRCVKAKNSNQWKIMQF